MQDFNISFPNFGFLEYAILAILLAILQGLSSMELSAPNRKDAKFSSAELIDMKKSSAVAFVGLLVTLAAGLGAQFTQRGIYDTALMLVPFPFIIAWASYYYRSSKSTDFKSLESEMDNEFSRVIVTCIRDNSQSGSIAFDALYSECLKRLQKVDRWSTAISIPLNKQRKLLTTLGFNDVLNVFTLSEVKFEVLLKELLKNKEILEDGSRRFSIQTTKIIT
jgi:hypothetical protein